MKVLILYHFMRPDTVVSAEHLSDLAEGIASKNWEVTCCPSNRLRRSPKESLPKVDYVGGVFYRRVWRPNFSQDNKLYRIINTIWITLSWVFISVGSRHDIIIVGTDPPMSQWIAPIIKLFRPKTKLVFWCLDLHPDGLLLMLRSDGVFSKILRGVSIFSLKFFDVIVSVGDCMRYKLEKNYKARKVVTIEPWPITSIPTNPDASEQTCTEIVKPRGSLLYPGSFGIAHQNPSFCNVIETLATQLSVDIVLSNRGVINAGLEVLVQKYTNITYGSFVEKSDLLCYLRSFEIHLVCLKDEWCGVSVPSKFFGSISVGRPVLFVGPSDSHVAKLIIRHNLGWVIETEMNEKIFNDIARYLRSHTAKKLMEERCIDCSKTFSKETGINRWLELLKDNES